MNFLGHVNDEKCTKKHRNEDENHSFYQLVTRNVGVFFLSGVPTTSDYGATPKRALQCVRQGNGSA